MYSSAYGSVWNFIMLCAIVGFFSSIVGIGYLIYWLFKHVAFV